MTSSAPQIGFDRFVQLEWVAVAMKVRAGLAATDDLSQLLDTAALGKEAKAKTRTKLNALCLEPRTDIASFVDRGVGIFRAGDACGFAAFAWGASIATYPFFGKVSEFVGRLTSIQGDCSVAEIHRRMSEVYGDRQVTKRATQAVIQTQASWGAIERVEKGKRLVRKPPIVVSQAEAVAWLVEAALRYIGKSVAVPTLQSLSVLYPFVFEQSLAYVVSRSPNLEVRSDGTGNQLVCVQRP